MGINANAPEWPRRQIAALLRARIETGELGPKLPSQMSLANELDVSPTTIQKALAILKDEGIIYTVDGLGTFVADKQ